MIIIHENVACYKEWVFVDKGTQKLSLRDHKTFEIERQNRRCQMELRSAKPEEVLTVYFCYVIVLYCTIHRREGEESEIFPGLIKSATLSLHLRLLLVSRKVARNRVVGLCDY